MATKRDNTTGADKSNRKENQQAGMEAISAIDLLEEDHRLVEGFFEEYEKLEAAPEKEQLGLKICLALRVHAQIEEEIFYPAAREAIEKAELIDEAIVEHAAAKQLIAEIEGMEASDELYDAKVKVLGEQVSHHIEEEEDELFPQVKSSELDLDALGKKMAERKATLFQQVVDGGEPG
jgi:hemerythrin superfamily protein